MTDVTTFQVALETTAGKDRALLIGNGFSIHHFSYANLLAEAGLDDESPLRKLFTALDTVDFEAVVQALENAVIVEDAYGNVGHSQELATHAQEVREALVKAVNKTHPKHKDELAHEFENAGKFISNFKTIFSLNYDLLLYWLNLEKGELQDGFGLGDEIEGGRFRGPFKDEAYCSIFNLHGGLHLFRDGSGDIYKALNTSDGVIKTVTNTILAGRLPVYVAEGTSAAKMGKISSSPYLRLCYDKLRENAANMFIYGHSAAENDAHIYLAIFSSKAEHVFFGVNEPTNEKVLQLDAQLAKYQRLGNKGIQYTFFDSSTAHVWDSPVTE